MSQGRTFELNRKCEISEIKISDNDIFQMGSSETVHYWRVRRTNIENTKFPKIFEIFDNDTFCTLCLPNPSLIQIMLIHTRRWTIWGKVRKIVAESESGFFLPLTRDNVSKWKDFNTFLVVWESESDYVRKWNTKRSLLKLDPNVISL